MYLGGNKVQYWLSEGGNPARISNLNCGRLIVISDSKNGIGKSPPLAPRLGSNAMLYDGVDKEKLGLFGRWRSDEMINFLHIQAEPLYRDLSARMLRGGDYLFLAGTEAHGYWNLQSSGLYH